MIKKIINNLLFCSVSLFIPFQQAQAGDYQIHASDNIFSLLSARFRIQFTKAGSALSVIRQMNEKELSSALLSYTIIVELDGKEVLKKDLLQNKLLDTYMSGAYCQEAGSSVDLVTIDRLYSDATVVIYTEASWNEDLKNKLPARILDKFANRTFKFEGNSLNDLASGAPTTLLDLATGKITYKWNLCR